MVNRYPPEFILGLRVINNALFIGVLVFKARQLNAEITLEGVVASQHAVDFDAPECEQRYWRKPQFLNLLVGIPRAVDGIQYAFVLEKSEVNAKLHIVLPSDVNDCRL